VRIIAVLLCAYVLAFAQRQLPAAMSEIGMARLGLSDTGYALLLGACFALPYATLAIIAGMFADRLNRLRLAGAGLAIASLATIGSAFAVDGGHLMALRLLIGLGQAALVPAAYFILGDIVPANRVGSRAAGFATGPFIGMGLAFVVSSQIATGADGGIAFLLMGTGGLVATVLLTVMKEPDRPCAEKGDDGGKVHLANWAVVASVDIALGFAAMSCHTLAGWGALWLCRIHGYAHGDAVVALGFILMAAGIGASILVGPLSRRIFPDRWTIMLELMSACALSAAILSYALFSAPTEWTLVLLGAVALCAAAATIAGPAILQEMTSPALRGRQHGIAIAVVNLIGAAGGPLIIGMASDAAGDPAAIGLALKIVVPCTFAASALFAIGAIVMRNSGRSARYARTAILDRISP
jgi:MFS family permease